MEEDDKQVRFNEALQRFRSIADRDSQTAKTFAAAFHRLTQQNREISKIDPESDTHYADSKILYYLGDAVDIYERRRDEYQGQTALLFDPKTMHIKEIRHIIDAIKSAEAFPSGSNEHNAALSVEQALNDVQQNAYTPKTVKRDTARLYVIGYQSAATADPIGKGVVAREFGQRDAITPPSRVKRYKGAAMLEMASAAVMPHIQEGNAINHYAGYPNDAPVDITAIMTDGTTRRFNFFVPDQEMPLRDYMVYRYRPPADHLPVFLEIREKFKKGEGAAA